MKIIDVDINDIKLEEVKNLHLCLGYFDGLHLGHQKIINEALKNGVTGVMTFDNPPNFALGKNIVNCCLTSLYDKSVLLEDMGVKHLYILRMSKKLLDTPRDVFVEKVLKAINPAAIYVGDDYRFGKDAKGTPNYLSNFFEVHSMPLLQCKNRKISSRYIKDLISEGKVEQVSEYLGRNYSLVGLVVEGKGNGKKIGFPTANLDLDYPYVLPKIGVYMGYVKVLSSTYKAIMCISTHPTVMELNKPLVEVHLLYYKGDLYGREIEVEFVSFMRDVIKFDSIEDLQEQLKIDREIAKDTLKNL
ncbi:MAG: riboflavin biosynthesis protein RibF [Bacilli bacterium]|nr:riboflavin biosynthesis protein RibF [Bacilli bacterium]